MKKIYRMMALALALLLLPLAAQAWVPTGDALLDTLDALPAGVRALLPDALAFRYAYRIGGSLYAWTADAQGNGVMLVFAEDGDEYTAAVQSAPFGSWNGLSPKPGNSGGDFFSVDYSESYTFVFRAGADGRWALRGAYNYAGDADCFMMFYPHVAVEYRSDRVDLRRVYGSWTRSLALDTLDSSVLPQTFDGVLAMLDTQGWAMVQAPDSGETAPLYTDADAGSACLGLYYTGAPAEALEQGADWCRVRVGGAEGWMRTDMLVFGDEMRAVTPNLPILALTEEAYAAQDILYASPCADGVPARYAEPDDAADALFVIGIVDGRWYHVISWNGDAWFIETGWFFEGNG